MQPVKIESERITLPPEVLEKLMGKEIRFVEFQDGFFMKPLAGHDEKAGRLSKLSKLRPRKLIKGDPDELADIKVGEWNETNNL